MTYKSLCLCGLWPVRDTEMYKNGSVDLVYRDYSPGGILREETEDIYIVCAVWAAPDTNYNAINSCACLYCFGKSVFLGVEENIYAFAKKCH